MRGYNLVGRFKYTYPWIVFTPPVIVLEVAYFVIICKLEYAYSLNTRMHGSPLPLTPLALEIDYFVIIYKLKHTYCIVYYCLIRICTTHFYS